MTMAVILFPKCKCFTFLVPNLWLFSLAGFSCRYKSRLKGTRESFSLDLQGRETNILGIWWNYPSALFHARSGPYFETCNEFFLSSSLSLWLSSSSFIFTGTWSSDVMLTFLFEIHQILWQLTILAKSVGTVYGRWLHRQPLLRPRPRNPASPLIPVNFDENSIVPSSFLTTFDLFFRIASFSFNIARERGGQLHWLLFIFFF